MDSLTLKHHNSFQNKNDRKPTQLCSQISDFKVATKSLKIQGYLRELEHPRN